ncbi:MAG: hypothetical protein WA854_08545, partial [Candidatus Binataceae bacterium]
MRGIAIHPEDSRRLLIAAPRARIRLMRTFSIAVFFAASIIFVSSLQARAAAAAPDLASYDWSVNAKPNLATKPPPEEAIRAFLAKLYANDPDVGEPPSAI